MWVSEREHAAARGRSLFPIKSLSFAMTPQDRSFTFILKTPPASDLLKKAAEVGPV